MIGSRWVWPIIAMTAALTLAGILRLVLAAVSKMGETGNVDPLDDEIWHRYEEGDVTREEFQRLRRKKAA
jgi:hypothetical protein